MILHFFLTFIECIKKKYIHVLTKEFIYFEHILDSKKSNTKISWYTEFI